MQAAAGSSALRGGFGLGAGVVPESLPFEDCDGNRNHMHIYKMQAAKLEPNHMPAWYAIAVHRIRDTVRSQCSGDQLLWASNETATVLKEGDPSAVDAPIAWAGLVMAHRAQHEIAAAYDTEHINLNDAEERALYTLKQMMKLLIN